ncbi:MAG TPA: hypothetical protein VK209_09660 [Candidatus Sulfotelmatobacter sp.]|nr:hypothetical protein [Candidatus Sulfotelmatobacter sp.]
MRLMIGGPIIVVSKIRILNYDNGENARSKSKTSLASLRARYPQIIHKTTSNSFEYTFGRTGNSGAIYGLEGRTTTLTVVDSNGLSATYSQVMMILPPTNIIPEVPWYNNDCCSNDGL